MSTSEPILISSCLLGIKCRYDGNHSRYNELMIKSTEQHFIPICPEQLGGLPTPRVPSQIVMGDGKDVLSGKAKVVNDLLEDVTEAFIKGAKESLKIAKITGAVKACLKSNSPSCGLKTSYCETKCGYGLGVTAALFVNAGIEIIEIDPSSDS